MKNSFMRIPKSKCFQYFMPVLVWIHFSLGCPAALIAHWRFDETHENLAFDGVGGHHAQLVDCVRVPGRVGTGALRFNGSTSYALVGLAPELDLVNSHYTISVWVRIFRIVNHHNGINRIITKDDAADTSGGYALGFGSLLQQGRSQMFHANHNPDPSLFYFGEVVENVWSHVAITWNGNLQKAYIDGILVESRPVSPGIESDGDDPLVFGAVPTTPIGTYFQNLDGELDDIRIYNQALTDSEVRHLVQSASPSTDTRQAIGRAQIVNGFLVGVEILDGGLGYLEPPSVLITGPNGLGARVISRIEGGKVIELIVESAGSGYVTVPNIVIAPPPTPPRRAIIGVEVINGFLVNATILDGGFGYLEPPFVRIVGTGQDAVISLTVEEGVVTGVTIANAGSGYGENTKIVVASPPTQPSVAISVSRVMLTMQLVMGRRYVLESQSENRTWVNEGEPFTANEEIMQMEVVVNGTMRLYRVRELL